MESNNSNVTCNCNSTYHSTHHYVHYIVDVITYVIISIGLLLTLVAIYSLYYQVKNNSVAPIYISNLLISDIIQFCTMTVLVAEPRHSIHKIFHYLYHFGLMASVGFMVCIALKRYLLIAWPLWYRSRRTIKNALVLCVMVWSLPLVYVLPLYFVDDFKVSGTIYALFLLIPYPLFIFFLGGTLKALSAAILVPSEEKRRIVGILVLVLLIYTLLFVPTIIWSLVKYIFDHTFTHLTFTILKFSPLADLILYFFMRKGAIDKLLASLCCCRINIDDNSRSSA